MMGDLYEAYKRGEHEKPTVGDIAKLYRKAKPEWAGEFGCYVYDQAMRDLDRAMQAFFRRVKAGDKEKGYPKFKSRYSPDQGFYVHNRQMSLEGHTVTLPVFGAVNMAEPLRYTGKIMGGRITKRAGKWHLCVQVEDGEEPPPMRDGAPVGVDLGLKTLAITSDGDEYANPRYYQKAQKQLARLQRIAARKKRGSKRSERVKLKVQRLHERVANMRADAIHKMTDDVTERYSLVALEDLSVKGMQRGQMSKSVSDAAFGEIGRQMEYKAQWRGGRVVRVGRFFPSSKACHVCGTLNGDLKLDDRVWTCSGCGAVLDRDYNAAVNIRDEAIRIAAAGECSQPADSVGKAQAQQRKRKARASRAEGGVHEAAL
jgi:putative transposase